MPPPRSSIFISNTAVEPSCYIHISRHLFCHHTMTASDGSWLACGLSVRAFALLFMTIGAFLLSTSSFLDPTLDHNPPNRIIISATTGILNFTLGLFILLDGYRSDNLPIWKPLLSGISFSGGATGISAMLKITSVWKVVSCIVLGFVFGLAFFDGMERLERRKKRHDGETGHPMESETAMSQVDRN